MGKKYTNRGVIITAIIVGVVFYVVASTAYGIGNIDVVGGSFSYSPLFIGILGGVVCYLGGRIAKGYKT